MEQPTGRLSPVATSGERQAPPKDETGMDDEAADAADLLGAAVAALSTSGAPAPAAADMDGQSWQAVAQGLMQAER